MSHIQSHHGGAEGEHNTYLVILKIHGNSIHLWSHKGVRSFRIACHNVETHSDYPGSNIQQLVLTEPAPMMDESKFQDQKPSGQVIQPDDMITFMSAPVSSLHKASYAIELAPYQEATVEDRNAEMVDSINDIRLERVGSAFVYLDPEFSTQGIQRTPVISRIDHVPIGQVQVEYLVVTNPVAFEQPAPKPGWLFNLRNLSAGHRGSGSGRRVDLPEKLLENSIDSFNYAHRHGADMCELDILITADGIPIVYHDFDVDAVAAQQSSNELGKFRVQVNQFTHKQLRDFRLLALHDGEGCLYTLNVPNQEETNRPFPTLEEVLQQVDEACGLNIEIKWPQQLESGKMEARRFREINDFLDRIIDVVLRNAGNRRIVLESFDADLTVMLRLKQTKYPVIFLSQGMTERYERYADMRARSIWNGVYLAQAFDLAGVDLISDYYLVLGKELVNFIENHNLVARAWGDMGENHENLDRLRELNLQCLTYDKIDLAPKYN